MSCPIHFYGTLCDQAKNHTKPNVTGRVTQLRTSFFILDGSSRLSSDNQPVELCNKSVRIRVLSFLGSTGSKSHGKSMMHTRWARKPVISRVN